MTAPAPLGQYFHVGIIVPDLEAAQAEMTELIGVEWGPVLALPEIELRDADGNDLLLPNKFCYFVGEPHLELIEEVPGSVWACNEHSNLHHLGFWSGDLTADSARLAAAGCPMQLCGRAGTEAPNPFAYHQGGLGVRLEILDGTLEPTMSFLFAPPQKP